VDAGTSASAISGSLPGPGRRMSDVLCRYASSKMR
jgi:hypothetical protein